MQCSCDSMLRTAQPSRQIISFCLPTVFADLWWHIEKINIESVRVYLIIYLFICFPKQFCGVTREYQYNRAARRYLNRHLSIDMMQQLTNYPDQIERIRSRSSAANTEANSGLNIKVKVEHLVASVKALTVSDQKLPGRASPGGAMSWCGAPRWRC